MSAAYVLVVDDETGIRETVQEILEDEGYEVGIAEDGASARAAMQKRRPNLVILDIWMPDIDGITLLKEWSVEGLPCPVIMVSGHGTIETAVEATRLGAYDFLEKPLTLAKLLLTVEHALEADKLQQENIGLKLHSNTVQQPVGKGPTMQRLKEQVKRIAQHDTWVLMQGESGSGKELFAHYLHSNSSRKSGPFIDVGVASIAKENSATELFGSEQEGKIHYGRLEQANGGILFLDEVADMEAETQARLLSALETKSFLRVGGVDPVQINVRIIAATSKNLEEEVQQGRFREDLYYHLNVVPINTMALREHKEDIPELLTHYIDHFVKHEKLSFRRFTVGAQNQLRNYPWPGNVRELKNMVQRLLILGAGEEISMEEVQSAMGSAPQKSESGAMPSPVSLDLPLREAREQFEKLYLEYQLQQNQGSVGKLSKAVGMERTHLYRKLRALGIEFKAK
ncbi:MAG: sigma-54-dependent Fis family transcriptional regulator [Methylococcales bacterium]|jgi:two-component system, NtrC family, nitrogen regulation response regulator NtrX|nr:sigma-54-dependent Fis family transcriptional regulator [Methylococcales bacterium]